MKRSIGAKTVLYFDEAGDLDAGRIASFFYAPQDGHYYGKAVRIAKAHSVGREIKEATR